MTTATSDTQSDTEQPVATAPTRMSSRKSVMALSVFALAINGTAAFLTLPSFEIPDIGINLPNVSNLAEVLLHPNASAPSASVQIPQPIVAELKDIQSAQQQQDALLRENGSLLLQNTVQLQQDSATLLGLRQSLTDERVDIKKISNQLSTLIAKVDALQSAMAPEFTSSIPKGRARNRLIHKKWAWPSKPWGPVSIGGAPLSTAPAGWSHSPEG